MKVRTRKVGRVQLDSRTSGGQLVTKSLAEARRAKASEPGAFLQASLQKARVRRIPARARIKLQRAQGGCLGTKSR